MNRSPRPKKCKSCGDQFQPRQSFATACSPKCAMALTHKAAERSKARERIQARARTRADRVGLRTRRDWEKLAQVAVNAYVRLRDSHLPCISCGKFHTGQWHAGHYLSTGARPELRFEPMNIHRQCQPCNTHLSGNLLNYRINLIKRIGLEAVEALEADHAPRKHTIDDLKQIEATYKGLAKEIQRRAA